MSKSQGLLLFSPCRSIRPFSSAGLLSSGVDQCTAAGLDRDRAVQLGLLMHCCAQLASSSGDLDGVGYRFMAGGQLMTREGGRGEPSAQQLQEAQDAFLAKLDEVEALLGKHSSGPFFMGCALSARPASAAHSSFAGCRIPLQHRGKALGEHKECAGSQQS